MQITDPGGQPWRVKRRWLPWRVRSDSGAPTNTGDELIYPAGMAEGVLRVLLLPVVVALRAVHVRPWSIEAWRGDELIQAEPVRGWRCSADTMTRIADAISRGDLSSAARRAEPDGGCT